MRLVLASCLALAAFPAHADGWALIGAACENGPTIIIEGQRIERLDFSCEIEGVAETASGRVYTASCLTDAPSVESYVISVRPIDDNTAEIEWQGIDKATYQRCVRR